MAATGSLSHLPKLEPRRRRPGPSNSLPRPETPALPSPPAGTSLPFRIPTRRILSPKDHGLFLDSPTFNLIVGFVFALSESVQDTPCSAIKEGDLAVPVTKILGILQDIEKVLQETPPAEQGGSRFGNSVFRDFLDKLALESSRWHASLGVSDATDELSAYLLQSFGNRARIDYGSGHELNFVIWLLCLRQLRVLSSSDFPSLVLSVFSRYLQIMRKVQLTYYLEPAGSHGVWGLDDYQFLPFLFGASQLFHHPFITPLSIHRELTLEEFADEYLYLGQVAFVNSTKTVKGLRWHSPLLDDISSAKSWAKIEGGMRRMFVSDVLGKLPVMQHFLFGSLVPALPEMSMDDAAVSQRIDEEPSSGTEDHLASGTEHSHSHQHVGWGDCCGIKVPSSVAAAQELKKQEAGSSFRRIPFD